MKAKTQLCALFLFAAAFIYVSVACGGGGTGTTDTPDFYERKPGMTEFVSADEEEAEMQAGRIGPTALEQGQGDAPVAGNADGDYEGDKENVSGGEIVEPDLYHVDDDILYIVNRYMGLFIVDLSQGPDMSLLANLRFKGSPRDMFTEEGYLFILMNEYISEGLGQPEVTSALLKVNVSDPSSPYIESTTIFDGRILESRKGEHSVIVVLGEEFYYGPVMPMAGVMEFDKPDSGFRAVAIDDAGDVISSVEFDAPVSAVHAAQGRLAVCTTNYESGTSEVNLFNVSATDGTLAELGTATVTGRVTDKFKIHFGTDHCFVVSHSNSNGALSYFNTVSLTGDVETVASLELAKGEQQFASRFSDDVCFLVTFEQIDPLWAIDFSDPSEPFIASELEMPGWSIYLELDGDRMISVGYSSEFNSNLVAKLFDISDPSAITLLAEENLTDQWGWTPVAHDDKAFGLFSDEGLFAVPVAGYDAFGPHNYHNYCKTWLVEYGDTDLTLRGSISGEEMFHRTLLESGYLYAFSDTELVSFDITNLDVPVLEDRIELARNVLDIHPVTGGFVRAVQRDFSCTTEFVSGTDPNGEAAYSADIENASFYSMYVNGSYTYLVVRSNAPNMPSLMQLRVLDHTDGFALKGTLDLSSVPAYHWFGNNAGMPMMEDRGSLVRLADDLLVMKAYSYNGPRPFDGDIEEGDVPFPDDPGNWPERPDEEDFPGGGDDGGFSPPDDGGPGFNGQGKADLEGYYNAKESLLFIDLAQPTDPNICSRISIPAGSGELFADDGILYVSYWKGHGVDPFGHSASKYFVVCVDATDRTDIVASEPVNTPGRLVAVDNSVLYTSEVVYNGTNAPVRLFNALQISQGKANLTDSVEIPMDLLNVLMGEDGRMAAGFVRPDRYYIMADAPMESVSTGAEYSAQVYPPVEPENGKLVILNTSNPADLSITGQYEVASAYAELLSVSSPYVFVRTGSMLALQFKLVSGELEVADHVLCGWGYYGNRMRFATENAYIPAGLFGVAIFDLTK